MAATPARWIETALLVFCVWSAWRTRRVDFLHRLARGAEAEAVTAQGFDEVIPVLVQDGYATVARGGRTTVFEHRFVPAWTVLVAIFLFPVGLVALLVRGRETVVIVSGERLLELHGYCSKATTDFHSCLTGAGYGHKDTFMCCTRPV